MILIAEDLRDFKGSIMEITMQCNARAYPTEYQTYDEAWAELHLSNEALRDKLGDARSRMITAMLLQAKAHYDAAEKQARHDKFIEPGEPGFEDSKLGSWLMQDIEMVIDNKQPKGYPKDMRRW